MGMELDRPVILIVKMIRKEDLFVFLLNTYSIVAVIWSASNNGITSTKLARMHCVSGRYGRLYFCVDKDDCN